MACLALLAIFLAPPATGAILVVSLNQETPGEIARWAIERDARLLGPGPWPNSLVVMGSRARLFEAALAHRGLLMTAAFSGCQSGRKS